MASNECTADEAVLRKPESAADDLCCAVCAEDEAEDLLSVADFEPIAKLVAE